MIFPANPPPPLSGNKVDDIAWMRHALALAQKAKDKGEVPVGAVLVQDDKIIGEGFNCPISSSDPTAHAEIQAIRMAATSLNNYRLVNTTLYVTLEPCLMCQGAIIQARIQRVVWGAPDKSARVNHHANITPSVLEKQCSQILMDFFKEKREGSVTDDKINCE